MKKKKKKIKIIKDKKIKKRIEEALDILLIEYYLKEFKKIRSDHR